MIKEVRAYIIYLIVGVLLGLGVLWLFNLSVGVGFKSTWVLASVGLIYVLFGIDLCMGETGLKSAIAIAIFMLSFIVFIVGASPLITHKDRRAMIGEVEVKEFDTTIQVVSTDKLRVLDERDALKHAENLLGSEPSIGSQYGLRREDFTLQTIDGGLYWVAPLQYNGVFKWLNNRTSGTMGYIKVNATTREVEWEKEYGLKYITSAYFSNNVYRKAIREHGRTKGYTDFSFEVDDSGKPYYVATVYKNSIGYKGKEAEGILKIDPTDGASKYYSKGEEPEWVDRVIPESAFRERVAFWGEYVKGWPNLSNEGKLRASSGWSVVYNEGRAHYYTGITSYGADEATTGFMLMDTKTGDTVFYKVSGATENKARSVAEGRVQNAGYKATFPVLINVGGEATYFMTLKDNNGNIAEYAFVSVTDYTKSGVGRDIQAAQVEYLGAIGQETDTSGIKEGESVKQVKGVVERVASQVVKGETTYYIKIEGKDEIYNVVQRNNPAMVLTEKGDSVVMDVRQTKGNEVVGIINENIGKGE